MYCKPLQCLIAIIVLFVSGSTLLSAEFTLSTADSLYNAGETEEALKQLKRIYQQDENNLQACLRITEIYDQQDNYEYAIFWGDRARKLDENNLSIHYILAKSFAMRSYIRSQPFRYFDNKDAEKNFEYVFKTDSSYNRILFEYAKYKGYHEKYFEAIQALDAQLTFYPDDVEAMAKRILFYDTISYFGDDKDSQKSKNMSTGIVDFYFAEYCRYHDNLQEADSIYSTLLNANRFSATALHLAKAKLAVQQEQFADAEQQYTDAVASINTLEDAIYIYSDMKFIFSDSEYEYYQNLATVDKQKDFFTKTWLRRNPLPSSAENPRLLEHIKRMVFAEKNFRTSRTGPIRTKALQIEVNNTPLIYSASDRFEDRGMVYLRHGAPRDKAIGSGGAIMSFKEQTGQASKDIENYFNSGESWFYPASGGSPKMIFHFAKGEFDKEPMLTPCLPQQMIGDCYTWDKKYAWYYNSRDEKEMQQFQNEIILENRETIKTGLDSDRHQWTRQTRPIDMPFYIAAFAAPKGMTRFEIYYGISNASKDTLTGILELGYGVFDTNWNELESSHKTITADQITVPSGPGEIWTDAFSFEVYDQDYLVSFYAKSPDMQHIGGHKFRLRPRMFSETELCMSDLELARELGAAESQEGPFVKNDLYVVPQPNLKFHIHNPVNVYFEIYNLPVITNRLDYQIQYRVTLKEPANKNLMASLTGFNTMRETEQSATLERFSGSRFSAESVGLDLNEMEPGQYEIEVVVVLADGEKVSKMQKFELLGN